MMKYDLNNFIVKYQDKDYITILMELTKEVQHLDNAFVKLKRNQYDEGLTDYRSHVGDFLFYLNTGVIPGGIGVTGIKKFLPIITNLVEKAQLKPELLNQLK